MAEDKDSKDALATLPGLIVASRDDFARLYDAEALAREKENFTPLHALVQIERLLDPVTDTTDRGVFALAFRAADKGGWLRDLVRRVVIAGVVAMPGGTAPDEPGKALRAGIGRLVAPDGAKVEGADKITLQANVEPGDGYVDPMALSAEMNRASRRVCQILVDRKRMGTGFLVGPQVVLTNWHVVAPLFGKAGPAPMTRIEGVSVKAVFDRFNAAAGAGPVPAGDGSIHVVTSVDAVDAAYDAEISGTAEIDPAVGLYGLPDERLDFALLRLEGLPGVERGWYRIEKDIWPNAGASIFVVQYPGQYNLKASLGRFGALHTDATRRRVRYNAMTAHGSSGGLCLSYDTQTATLKPSALHQSGVQQAAVNGAGPNRSDNQGVPLAKIAPHVQDLSRQVFATAPILRLGTASGTDHAGAPVLGRALFQKHVADALTGEARILIVRPDAGGGQSSAGFGKSFSEVLLRSLLSPDAHVIAAFKASDIPSDATACAKAILSRVGPPDPAAEWSRPDSAGSTYPAWISDTLVRSEFAQRLAAAAGNRLVWLVIDELDKTDLADAGGRHFLAALYQQIESIPALRVVLIGLTADLPSCPQKLTRVEVLSGPPGLTDVMSWLTRRLGNDRAVEPDLLESLARLVQSSGDASGAAALARAIRSKVDPVLPAPVNLTEESSQ